MSRAVIVLHSQIEKARARAWIDQAAWGTRVTFNGPKRTLPQNERMWAMLTDVARQVKWHGQKLSPDDWKVVFLSALKAELRMVPNLDGNGFVQLGRSSSALSVDEMSDLMALIEAFGAREGVMFGGEEAA
jgi:hypothetical protein